MRHAALAATALTAAATLGLTAGSAAAAPSTTPGSAATPSVPGTPAWHGDAAPPATLSQVQAKGAAAISQRVSALQAAATKVQADTSLGADQATLLGTLDGNVSHLQQLGQQLAATTDLSTAKADYEDIFSQYRVYVLVLPVTRMVAVADRIHSVTAPRATAAGQRLGARVTPADQAQVQPLLSDLGTQVSAATQATSGLPATLLALTPAQWNADHGVLTQPHTQLKSAVTALKQAASDLKQARADIRAAGGAHRTPGTSSTTAPAGAPTPGASAA